MRRHALLLVSLLHAACASDVVLDDADVGAGTDALAAADWSTAPPIVGPFGQPWGDVAVAFLGDTAYAVVASAFTHEPFLTRRLADGTWTAPATVPGIATEEHLYVELAAFDGRLYLLAQEYGTTQLMLSRYEPSTGTWSPPSTLPFEAYDQHAVLVVYDGHLVLVGAQTSAPFKMWMARMDTLGAWEPAVITPLDSSYRPAVVSHGGRLHVFYRSSSSPYGLRHAAFDGVAWTPPDSIAMGYGAELLDGYPSVASYAAEGLDCLHLVAMGSLEGTSHAWWTYACDGEEWSVPVTILSGPGYHQSSLGASSSGLLFGYRSPGGGHVSARTYHYPRADGQPCGAPSDCASRLCTTSYVDADGDGFGVGGALRLCGPLPAGHAERDGDCCDSDVRARPGQTGYFRTPRACGGYDFDCDGSAAQLHPARATAGCVSVGSCSFASRRCSGPYWTIANQAPPCGASASWRECFVEDACRGGRGSECGAYFSDAATQACR